MRKELKNTFIKNKAYYEYVAPGLFKDSVDDFELLETHLSWIDQIGRYTRSWDLNRKAFEEAWGRELNDFLEN